MTSELSLYIKLQTLPPELKQEVNEFVDSLVQKSASQNQKAVPVFGCAKGKIRMSADFDDPLDDFREYMQ
ncbi:hypothetical protein GCM10011325_30340 [Dyadobacter sediminis]|uniref:DUF2281 domain-containing protein n=2 Tax=Dyadobacter sediminis TaxID=1493691 RepID=A0A5R9KC97_9BACT|nr:DUF2281 domain-containing protein [Dyadobacter sediminis]GGC01074.1 hypothetical protein GCM10011325_30340 [Dyadobacter sediminis]